MIISGKNKLLNNSNSNLPNMANTIVGWFLDITFKVVERTMDGADWVESTEQLISTKGVTQPPRDEDLKILPEGSWNWEWLLLHCLPDVQLTPNQYVIWNEKLYKVMFKKDFTPYGYVRYTILEAFKADTL